MKSIPRLQHLTQRELISDLKARIGQFCAAWADHQNAQGATAHQDACLRMSHVIDELFDAHGWGTVVTWYDLETASQRLARRMNGGAA